MLPAWQVPKMWDGGEAWILGGGPSLIECFNIPKDVVNDVRFKRKSIAAYSPYLAAIHNKHTIGINVAYQFGSWVDICFFGDKAFYLAHREALEDWNKLVVTCSSHAAKKDATWLKYLPKEIKRHVPDVERQAGISTYSKAISWNENSGAASISLAAWLGAKRIILVGFDMALSETKNQHFHNEYKTNKEARKRRRAPQRAKELPFEKHLRGFPYIKRDADNLGIEIINTSLNSAIQDFPKVHIKELLS